MRGGRIRIGKGVITTLGIPEYICIYIAKSNDALMVRECEEKEYLSMKVTKSDNVTIKENLRLFSLQFTTDLFVRNHWNRELTYQLQGFYDQSRNAVIFNFSDAKEVI